MKKIIQLGNFLCDDETNLPIRGEVVLGAWLFSYHIQLHKWGGGLGIKIVLWK